MSTKNKYAGIDLFRVPAALLVVAIHTSPLAAINASADFFLTRVLARLAVPFFFMITGQFILSDYVLSNDKSCKKKALVKIWKYSRKILLLYGCAILIYLPIGIYAGHYENLTIQSVLKMLIFDGTFYHLWYFPACVTGIGIVCLLRRFFERRQVLFLTGLLYLAGLFGDSYFGIALKIPAIAAIYEKGFQVWSYTRNGLFMAPVFLMLGVTASDHYRKDKKAQGKKMHYNIAGFVCSFLLMTIEAFALRFFEFQRHDSMYMMLIPASLFLYQMLLYLPALSDAERKNYTMLRTATLWIYILHPAMIIVVRVIAKISGFLLLVNDPLIHYFCVAALSAVFSLLLAYLLTYKKKQNFLKAEHG